MRCRHCGALVDHTFLDLGFAPPSNAYLSADGLRKVEKYYPLKVRVCEACWLVQTEDYARADELFTEEYAYFSSTSKSWIDHASSYAGKIIDLLSLDAGSFVIEVGCNDGYLLKNFVAESIPCLGIEPTASTADAAKRLGVKVIGEFFGEELAGSLAASGQQADLIVGNNVYAHVPDINDFTRGIRRVLKPEGVVTLEFPHLMRLLENTQFDTIYHEHFSYLSLRAVETIFAACGLRIWHVEELPTHGGSLRVYGCRAESKRADSPGVEAIRAEEARRGLGRLSTYLGFQVEAERVKNDLVSFLIEQKRAARRVAGYGAAAKGNTLLNFGGVRPDLLPFVCDAAPAKQGKFLPGSHIPIYEPKVLKDFRPNYLLILPWNIAEEVKEQTSYLRSQGTRFVTAVPTLRFHE